MAVHVFGINLPAAWHIWQAGRPGNGVDALWPSHNNFSLPHHPPNPIGGNFAKISWTSFSVFLDAVHLQHLAHPVFPFQILTRLYFDWPQNVWGVEMN